jgi:pimeloyl-ACP methyl ester carboxylesterase
MSKETTFRSTIPRNSGRFKIDGHHLYWECYGREYDSHLVLLHHGLGSIRSWMRQIPDLVAGGFQVWAIDRWGYGRSDPRPGFSPSFLEKDAEEIVELLKTLHIDRTSFIGHSDGGSIALIIASRYPSLVEQLILVAAHIYVEPKTIQGFELIKAASQEQSFIRLLEREHGPRAQELVQAWLDGWHRHGYLTMNLIDELARVECPTLVVQGELDEHATARHAEDIAQGIKHSTLWLIPEVGHMPLLEIAHRFNERVLEFIIENNEHPIPSSKGVNEIKNVQ